MTAIETLNEAVEREFGQGNFSPLEMPSGTLARLQARCKQLRFDLDESFDYQAYEIIGAVIEYQCGFLSKNPAKAKSGVFFSDMDQWKHLYSLGNDLKDLV